MGCFRWSQKDSKRISAVIKGISHDNAALGSILANYAGRYAYTPILNAIDSVDCPLASA